MRKIIELNIEDILFIVQKKYNAGSVITLNSLNNVEENEKLLKITYEE